RPPSDDQLADLLRRYDAIGGLSPLAERTEAQRVGLQAALDQIAPGEFIVVLATKHATPSIEAAVDAIAADGIGRIVALVLAPHDSALSIGQYVDR
ncbi:MAG TPA: ferrochelatase, partial [Ilumatobacteraceae bacterium]|nr:ferrochelatase [Ilumatobacteraceae bacterium]